MEEKRNALFIEVHDEGVRKYVPRKKKRRMKKEEWLEHKCRVALEKRNKAWDKARKRKDAGSREE